MQTEPIIPVRLPPSLIINRYRVEERAGQGGTSIVLKCHDLHTEQAVAVKLLRNANPLVPASRARFHREARLAASLSHPNIIRVLDYGETDPPKLDTWGAWIFDEKQPIDFLCMEFIRGPTLKQLVRRLGACPQEWVVAVALQLASSLIVAHEAGIVHRDIKPQNILLLDHATHVVPKLGDFGIARDLTGASLTTLTQTGQVLGTPDYLSPEQVMGEPGGKTSDIYSLGIVMFEMLTGNLPFEAESPLAAASRRMFVDPPLPRSFVPSISHALEEVVLQSMRREPVHRLRSATELVEAINWACERDSIDPDDRWPFASEIAFVVNG
jgi:serine/threonine protein kinase